MNQFTLSTNVNPNKVFTINLNQLEGRLDPNAYHPDRLTAIKKLQQSGHELKKLRIVANFKNKKVTEIPDDDTKYVGLENVESNTGKFIPTEEKDSISTATIFNKGDILFPKLRPYLNKVFLANFDGICSTEFHVIGSSTLNKEFLTYFLRSDLVVSQTSRLMSGNTLPRVQTEDIYNLLVPIPSQEKQKEIVSVMRASKQLKAQKETEAEELLNGIDDYLLSELGIQLPKRDDSLENRIFKTSFQNIAGTRFDPSFHSYSFSLKSPHYPNVNFLEHINIDPGWDKVLNPELEVSFVPMDSINDKYGQIESKENRTVKKSSGYTKFCKSDILWAKITPCMQNGKSAIARDLKNGYGFGSTEFFVLRCNNSVNTKYLLSLLRLKALRKSAKKYFGGASGHQRVSSQFFKDLKIPLPDRKIQDQIANEIESRKTEAINLKKEAQHEVENARKQIEEMILQEDSVST